MSGFGKRGSGRTTRAICHLAKEASKSEGLFFYVLQTRREIEHAFRLFRRHTDTDWTAHNAGSHVEIGFPDGGKLIITALFFNPRPYRAATVVLDHHVWWNDNRIFAPASADFLKWLEARTRIQKPTSPPASEAAS